MGVLNGNPKEEPMHYGEVSAIWSFLAGAKLSLSHYQTVINHTGDGDLRDFIHDLMDDTLKTEITRAEQILKENGIGLPPTPPERAAADPERIPDGARFSDPEIAAGIASMISSGLITCSAMMSMSIREDIAAFFGEIHMKKAQLGLRMLRMMKEKGWLVAPPLHKPELAGARS